MLALRSKASDPDLAEVVIGNWDENVAEIEFRIEALQFCRIDKRVRGRGRI